LQELKAYEMAGKKTSKSQEKKKKRSPAQNPTPSRSLKGRKDIQATRQSLGLDPSSRQHGVRGTAELSRRGLNTEWPLDA
jgi:hypothetical protein